MKVFYVMVLVLVAGAVPSHGRTESEGTVFNMTQPHESMNNVTVSSSKLETFDYLYLAMRWPRSFCNQFGIRRHQHVPGIFTVHGLWPQHFPLDPPQFGGYVDCTIMPIRRKYSQIPPFNIDQLDRSLVPSLNIYWPDLTTNENNPRFWGTEYNKHGFCTFNNQNLYFYLTLKMVESLGDLALKLSLIRPGPSIFPGGTYSARSIREAVHQVTLKRPRLVCNTVQNRLQLSEIRFCAQFGGGIIQLIDCNRYLDCGNQMVYFPPP